jgi:hypothetical protein
MNQACLPLGLHSSFRDQCLHSETSVFWRRAGNRFSGIARRTGNGERAHSKYISLFSLHWPLPDDRRAGHLLGWRQSLDKLKCSDPSKVFVCKLTDSNCLSPPFSQNGLWQHDQGHHYLTVFKSCSPLPGTGYLPCKEFGDALLESGYDGWSSVKRLFPSTLIVRKAFRGAWRSRPGIAWRTM